MLEEYRCALVGLPWPRAYFYKILIANMHTIPIRMGPG